MIRAVGVILQNLLEHRHQIADIDLMTGVFLCNLHLQHLVGLPKASHQRVNRLTNLKIHRAVLDLKDHVVVIIGEAKFRLRYRLIPYAAKISDIAAI